MDDLNGIILQNSKEVNNIKNNIKHNYVNPHLIYKALEEKEKTGFNEEENKKINNNNDINKRKKPLLGKSLSQIFNFKHRKIKEDCKSEVNTKINDNKKIILYKKVNSTGPFS